MPRLGLHSRGASRSSEIRGPGRFIHRDTVVCPGCGGPTRDAGEDAHPRWHCLRSSCAFVYGWMLDFATGVTVAGVIGCRPASDTPGAEARAMVAVPFNRDRSALLRQHAAVWPHERTASRADRPRERGA